MARPCRTDTPPTPFGAELRRLRKRAKKSQQATADAIGVKQASVSGWERGPDLPRVERLESIARLLGGDERRLRALWIKQRIVDASIRKAA